MATKAAAGWPGVAHELSSCRRGKRLAYTGGNFANPWLFSERLDVQGLQASLVISCCLRAGIGSCPLDSSETIQIFPNHQMPALIGHVGYMSLVV